MPAAGLVPGVVTTPWGFTAARSLPRGTTETVVASQLQDAIVRINLGVIDRFDVDTAVEEIVSTVNAVEDGLVRTNEQVPRLLPPARATTCTPPSTRGSSPPTFFPSPPTG
jgi:hypothetical protein